MNWMNVKYLSDFRLFSSLDQKTKCVIWMILSSIFFAVYISLGRYTAQTELNPLQLNFFRLFFALICFLPWVIVRGRGFFQTDQIWTYGIRSTISLAAMSIWFWSLAFAPVAVVTAISYVAPLITAVLAVLILKEDVSRRRWLSLLVGFVGILIILRPGIDVVEIGAWLALANAFLMGFGALVTKMLTTKDDPDKVVFISTLIMTSVALIPAVLTWTWPQPEYWPYLIALGPIAMLVHVTLTRAFSCADASFVMALDFMRLPLVFFAGILIFSEVPSIYLIAGALLICWSTFYVYRKG
ncbi:MAG: DMT family transporter [Hyphomicrobiaceae bacterium]|nr:DMT family transporter [Hyphomicrobiaceae bacterium]